ncbi:MAG: fimbrial chaperone protein [Paraglaciecola sp.]|jgi:fimbrial chaperone protein
MNSKIHTNLTAAALAGALFFTALVPRAQAVILSSVHLDMSVKKPIISLTVTNDSTEVVTYQINTLTWAQVDGQNIYNDTNDLMVTPPIVSIEANSAQVFRVALFKPDPHLIELSYRVILDNITSEARSEKKGTSLSFVFSHNVPLFFAPLTPVDSILWSRCASQVVGESCLRMENKGNRHTKMRNFSAVSATTQEPYQIGSTVLAGSSGQWLFATMLGDENTTHIEVNTDKGPITLILDDLPQAK